MWPSTTRSQTFFRSPGAAVEPVAVEPPVAHPPGKWKALLSYAALVFFSAFLALFMAEATDPIRGFLPLVVDPPPAHSEPRGFEASLGVSRLYARSAVQTPRPLVTNSGEYFAFPPAEGIASWYGYDHIGRKTADGGWFDPEAMTAAHRTLPFGSVVRVTRLDSGASVEVTINDRGPYHKNRIIDLARRPASELGLYDHGVASCRVEVLRYPVGQAQRTRRPRPSDVPMKKADPGLKALLIASDSAPSGTPALVPPASGAGS